MEKNPTHDEQIMNDGAQLAKLVGSFTFKHRFVRLYGLYCPWFLTIVAEVNKLLEPSIGVALV